MANSQTPFHKLGEPVSGDRSGTLGQRMRLALREALGPDYVSGGMRAFYIWGIRATVAQLMLVLSALPVFLLDVAAGGHSRSLQLSPILMRAAETLFAAGFGLFAILVVRAVHRALETMDGPGGLTPPHTEAIEALHLYFDPLTRLFRAWRGVSRS
jgi:hypothetical protein